MPDLRNRFIVGSGTDYDSGNTGGAASATSSSNGSHSHTVTVNSDGSHSHTVTVSSTTLSTCQMPSHYHSSPMRTAIGGASNLPFVCDDLNGYANTTKERVTDATQSHYDARRPNSGSSGSSASHSHNGSSGNAGSHAHTASSNSTGDHTHTVNTLPPYYALAFIIKL